MLERFAEVAARVRYRSPRLAVISNVSGDVAGEAITTPEYWVRQARETVRFAAGLEALARRGVDTFLELGPQPALLGLVRAGSNGSEATLIPSLRPPRSEPEALLDALGSWIVRGGEIDTDALYPLPRRRVPLPTYPFARQRHWLSFDTKGPRQPAWVSPAAAQGPAAHPLLGRQVRSALQGSGQFAFSPVTWEEMPTQYPIVNALAALPLAEFGQAMLVESSGGGDGSGQRRLL